MRFGTTIAWCAFGGLILAAGVWQAGSHFAGWGRDGPRPEAPASSVRLTGILAEGRLEPRPGAKVVVSGELIGVVTNIVVQEKSAVSAGDLIAEVKADDVYAALMEARARVAELGAEVDLARSELQRGRTLNRTGALTVQELDRLEQQLATLEARRVTAEITVKRNEIALAKARIVAPIRGVVLARHVQAGEVVRAGSPVVTLVDLDRTRIEAEVDEYDASHLKEGLPADIRAEGYEIAWHGRVEEIPDSVNPRQLLPQDPAQPSDVRVLLVKIALDTRTPLKLGQRVEVEIHTE